MQKCSYILFFLLFVSFHGFAQQNNRWYFGRNAGLNFNPGSQPVPSILSDGALSTNEGCASICDYNGNILFYSNGVTVYNRNHQVMLNGDNLKGNISSVQACIIVPVPGNDNLFYLFATDAVENNFANGYTYSIIDMSRDNGNGEVVTKNTLLWGACTERMVAARHANGKDVWLITNDKNSNVFRSWLIDCSGLQGFPVVSTTGIVMDQHFLTNNGMLKVSPDGKQICQTHFPQLDLVGLTSNFCQLFDFNNATGILSNPQTIEFPDALLAACEFSNDSKLLYFADPIKKNIEQVEPKLVPASAIISSRTTISTGTARYYGIQLAPDGKIYLADVSTSLGAINRPDIKGIGCDFRKDQLLLSPGGSYLGLPAYINDLSSNPTNGFSYTIIDSCTGRVQFNGLTTMPGIISWDWDFGDGNGSALQNPVHNYTPANQSYTVTLEITSVAGCGYIKRSKSIFPQGLEATANFDFTSVCDEGSVTFQNLSTLLPDSTGVRYIWTFGDGNTSTLRDPVHSFPSGTYNVKLDVLTSTPCLNKSITKTLNLDVLNITASPDREIDAGQSVQLSVTGGGSSFTWTPPTWLSDPTIANPVATPGDKVTYKVVVRNDAGCSDSDYVQIKVMPFPGIYMPTGFTPNNDGLNDDIKPTFTKEFTLDEFSIYNRWGQKVFSTSQRNVGWNGQLAGLKQDAGVYVWVINALDTRTNTRIEKKGTFVLVR
jgi:gliding motility-associated-like protein